MGNLLDPALQRSVVTWDQEDGSFSGVVRCKGCGRFLMKLYQVRAGAIEAPPCRTKTCAGYVNRLGFDTFTPPQS